MKRKLFSLLALLMVAVTGAWAQEGTLLVTMTAGETVTYDPATATDVAEITMTGATQLGTWEDYYYGNHYSWLNSSWNDTDKGTLEVTAKPGYTITKVVFSGSDIVGSPGSREVTASPFAVYPWGSGSAFGSAVYTSDLYTEIIKNTASNDILGIDKIEVYGYAGTPVTPTGDGYKLSVGTNAHGTVKFYVGQNEVTTAQEGDSVKVVVTPATGWSVNKPAGQWIAAEAAARSAVPMLNGFELETVAGQENTYKFLMERANAEVSVSYKKLLTHQDISIEAIADLTYTGDSLKPTVVVKDGETTLKLGTHYTVEYANNLNAALATAAAAPTVTICAVDTSSVYAGDTAVTFNILKAAGSISYKATELEKELGDAAFTNELTHIGDGKVTYSIEGRNIATVDENTGRVTITDGPGFFTITATVEEGDNYTYETTTASYEVNVGVRVKMPFIFDDDDRIIVANKMALYTVLEKAREINRSQITVESNIALTKAMEDAEEALYKKDVTVEELQAAREALLKAIDEVKPKEVTTGVSGMSGISGMSGGYYDLQGRKVTQPRKGIYIYKGKKVKK